MNPNNQQQSNRLQLNFGFQGAQNFGADQGRAYPTTPSTFPQPFPNPQGQQEVWGTAQQGMNSGFTNQGYFANNPYTSAVQQQQANLHAQQGYRPQPNQAQQQPQQQQQYHDAATNGLVHQFSNQNLGGPPRAQSPYARQVSPNPNPNRPRTANSTHQQQQHYSGPSLSDEEPPPKNPERFSTSIGNRAKLQTELVSTFFRDSVERARDRNARAQELETIMKDATVSDSRKQQKTTSMRRSEANFLRFLRTSERPQNYSTLKIIGKGAFGEVKLVQRKHDGKIYALKSLVKAEMFKKDQLAHVRAERDILANADSPWLVKLHTSFQDSTFL
ncbi:kinase-like protein, partial [Aureobasidium melanogenum]